VTTFEQNMLAKCGISVFVRTLSAQIPVNYLIDGRFSSQINFICEKGHNIIFRFADNPKAQEIGDHSITFRFPLKDAYPNYSLKYKVRDGSAQDAGDPESSLSCLWGVQSPSVYVAIGAWGIALIFATIAGVVVVRARRATRAPTIEAIP
jgi:hypothetical protein